MKINTTLKCGHEFHLALPDSVFDRGDLIAPCPQCNKRYRINGAGQISECIPLISRFFGNALLNSWMRYKHMKNTLYIAVTGVHGSGKTTLCGKLADAMREITADVAVGGEVARECPYPLSLGTTRKAQDWIYQAQCGMEATLRAEPHDVVIFDRTLLDNVLYTMRYIGIRGGHLDMTFTDQMDEAQGRLHNLDYNLVIRTHYVPELCVADAKRDSDNAFARDLEGLFDVFMAPFVDVDVMDVRDTDVIQTTVEWGEENL